MRKATFLIISTIMLFCFSINSSHSWFNNEKLFMALDSGEYEKVKSVLNENPDLIKENDQYCNTVLHFACSEDRYKQNNDIVKLLISKGADVDAKNNEGNTPLHIATEEGLDEIVSTLLENNANVNSRNNFQETPIDLYYKNKYVSNERVIKLLLSHGADIDLSQLKKYFKEKKYDNIKLYLTNNWKPRLSFIIILLFIAGFFIIKKINHNKHLKKSPHNLS